jgi:hypothetical protein
MRWDERCGSSRATRWPTHASSSSATAARTRTLRVRRASIASARQVAIRRSAWQSLLLRARDPAVSAHGRLTFGMDDTQSCAPAPNSRLLRPTIAVVRARPDNLLVGFPGRFVARPRDSRSSRVCGRAGRQRRGRVVSSDGHGRASTAARSVIRLRSISERGGRARNGPRRAATARARVHDLASEALGRASPRCSGHLTLLSGAYLLIPT